MRPYAVVAKEIGMSVSEFHAAVKRLVVAGLICAENRKPKGKAVEDFLVYGVPYIFPFVPGPMKRGIPTAASAAPLAEHVASGGILGPVWAYSASTHRGYAIDPLHPSAPKVAQSEPSFYAVLALIDALRGGKVRDRQFAREELHKRLFAVCAA